MTNSDRRVLCMARWVDPTRGRSTSAVGPYSCGRASGHKGVHAWDGNGACALWTADGELRMAVQQVSALAGGTLPEVLDAADATEAVEASPEGEPA